MEMMLKIYVLNIVIKNLLMKKIFFLLLLLSFGASAQKNALIKSGEIIEEGIKLYDNEEYELALKKYNLIDRNDTNYLWALYEKSLTYTKLEEFDEIKKTCYEGLKTPSSYMVDFCVSLGSAYDEMEQSDKAIEVYKKGLQFAPYYYLLNFNIALTYSRMEKYDSAIIYAKRAIDCNFLHASSHYLLGLMYAENEMYAQAMMPLQIFLLLENNSSRSENAVVTLSKLCQINEQKEQKKFSINKEDMIFDEINTIIRSKVALNEKYKTPVKKIKDPLIKQMYVLMEKLKSTNDRSNFWNRNYTNYFKNIYNEGYFLGHTYYIISGITSKAIQKEIKKEKSKIDKYEDWALVNLKKIRSDRYFYFNGKYQNVTAWYDSKTLSSLGEVKDKEAKQPQSIGPWEFFYSNGSLFGKAEYDNNGKKIGEWKFYYSNGNIRNERAFKDGELSEIIQYFEDGGIESITQATGIPNEFILKTYYYSGLPKTEVKYLDNERNGKSIDYYKTGEKEVEVEYKDDKEISFTEFYECGKIKSKYAPKTGGTSEYISYYENGNIKYQGEYISDKKNGKWINFYESGKTKSITFYDSDGDLRDTSYEYYENGNLAEIAVYKKEGKNGALKSYDTDGKIHYEYIYKNNAPISIKFYDKTGSVIYTSEVKQDKLDLKYTYPTGELAYTGIFKNGKKEGEWKYYYKNGNLKMIENYKGNKLNGKYLTYFENGSLNVEYETVDDMADGYFKRYYSNGKIELEGWYVKDLAEGYWYAYYPNGNYQTINYYINDKLCGFQQEFNVDGKLNLERFYKDNFIKSYLYFDTLGLPKDTIKISNGNGIVKNFNENKNILDEYTLANGYYSGAVKIYHNNGQVFKSIDYKYAKENGPVKYYDYKGNLTVEGNYVNGYREGEWKWYKNKKLTSVGSYKKDLKIGSWKNYSENEKLIETNEFDENGEILSKKMYAETGELIISKIYESDRLIAYTYYDKNNKLVPDINIKNETGKVTAYFANGNKSIEQEYKSGAYIGSCLVYYPNGKLYSETPYVNYFDIHGVKKEYWPNGKLKSEEPYENDELNGESKFYRADGTLEHTEMYYCGILHGYIKYYNEKGDVTKKEKYVYDVFYE